MTCEESGPETVEMAVGEAASFGKEKRMEPMSRARREERWGGEGGMENHVVFPVNK